MKVKKTYDYVTCCHERVNDFFPGFKTLNKVPIEKQILMNFKSVHGPLYTD